MSVTTRLETLSKKPELLDTPRLEKGLWLVTLLFYIVGDTLTTLTFLQYGGTEANPLVAGWIAEWGHIAVVGHKLLFLGIILSIVGYGDRVRGVVGFFADLLGVPSSPFRSAILFMFASRGVLLVGWNCYIIYLVVTDSGYALSPF